MVGRLLGRLLRAVGLRHRPDDLEGGDESRWGGYGPLIRSLKANRAARGEEEFRFETPGWGWSRLDSGAPRLPRSGFTLGELRERQPDVFIGGLDE